MGLASVVGVSLETLFPEERTKLLLIYQNTVLPRTGQNSNQVLRIMWTNTRRWPDRSKEFKVNHFVPLLRKNLHEGSPDAEWKSVAPNRKCTGNQWNREREEKEKERNSQNLRNLSKAIVQRRGSEAKAKLLSNMKTLKHSEKWKHDDNPKRHWSAGQRRRRRISIQGSSEDEMGGKVIENEHEDSSVHHKKNKQATTESATANLSATRREGETDKTVLMESKKTVMTEEQTVETQGKMSTEGKFNGTSTMDKRLKVQKLPTV